MLNPLRASICALVLTTLPAFADEASHRAAAERLLRTTGIEQQVELAYQNLRATMLANFENMNAPPEARPVYERFIDDLLALLSESLSWENTKEEYIDVFVAEFTEEDLGRLIDFYETPLGKKIVSVLPELYQKGAEIGQRRFEAIKPQVDELTDKMLDEIEQTRRQGGDGHQHE